MTGDLPPPNVVTQAVDSQRGIRFELVAYRTLTPQEVAAAVNKWRREHKGKTKRGSVIRLITVFGHER